MKNGMVPHDLRPIVYKKGKYKCAFCGMRQKAHKSKFGRRLTIDHIDGNGRDSESPNHDLSNLRVLCLPCHGKKDRARRIYPGRGWKRPDLINVPRNPITGKLIRRTT